MKNKDFGLVIKGKRENGEILVEINSYNTITEKDMLIVLDSLINTTVDSFGSKPMELILDTIPRYYIRNSGDFVGDIEDYFDQILPGGCPPELLEGFRNPPGYVNS